MERPALSTLACVNPACQRFRLVGQGNLVIRKVYRYDRMRLLRCRTCGEEFSERRGTALFNTKITEAKAVDVMNHVDEGCGVRSTARLLKVSICWLLPLCTTDRLADSAGVDAAITRARLPRGGARYIRRHGRPLGAVGLGKRLRMPARPDSYSLG
jgi:transposase-like protein